MAIELSRPDLMVLARQFVDRIGQKLQGDTSQVAGLNQIPEGELLLLKPRLSDKVMVDASIAAIKKNGKLYLSFREFCDGLAFPLVVDTQHKTAKGWFLKEDYNFVMDLQNNLVQSRGAQYTVTESDWFIKDGEIFISSYAIKDWMKIETELVLGSGPIK